MLILGAVAFVTVYPIALLLLNSFQVGQFGTDTVPGLANWQAIFEERHLRGAFINTLTLTGTRQAIAFVIGIGLAWIFARTNLPHKGWLEFGFWIAFFLPTLPVVIAWSLVLDGERGLLNQMLVNLPFVDSPPFELYSWWGITFIHLMTATIAVKVMLLTPAFRNMDASFEEAARISGAGTLKTLFHVVMPVMAPAIFVIFLLGTIKSLEAFEVELILGSPARIDVYSTLIYKRVLLKEPPEFGEAMALSMLVVALLLPFIVLQQWQSKRASHETISGKYSAKVHNLGRLRWPMFSVISTLVLLMTVFPIAMVVMGTFMRLFGFFDLPNPWTLKNWQESLTDPRILGALKNTMVIGIGAAAFSVTVFSLIAYLSVKTRFVGRSLLDFLTWLPATIPGIVISLGFLWLFLKTPGLNLAYGSIGALILAVSLASITLGVQLLKTNIMQIGGELEEAARVSGASQIRTFQHVVLPLIAPTLALVGLLSFVQAAKAISVVALLSTRSTEPLSMLQLDYMAEGKLEEASVIGVLILVLTIAVAGLVRFIGFRLRRNAQA
jgi:iron(III) transport system permease protein